MKGKTSPCRHPNSVPRARWKAFRSKHGLCQRQGDGKDSWALPALLIIIGLARKGEICELGGF